MQVGQQVVCVDDQFPKPLAKYYVSLPIKDKIYTIRAVFVGRRVMHPSSGTADSEIGLLLRELLNGTDPRNKCRQELGFNAERFRPLRHLDDNSETEAELVRVRAAPKAAPLKEMALPYSPNPQPESRADCAVAASGRHAICTNHLETGSTWEMAKSLKALRGNVLGGRSCCGHGPS